MARSCFGIRFGKIDAFVVAILMQMVIFSLKTAFF